MTAAPLAEIEYTSTPAIADALARLGRTEDVAFSPSGRRLAVAALTRNRIAVFDVAIPASPGAMQVALTGGVELSSAALHEPHGLDFVDDDALIVTSRGSDVALFELPPGASSVPAHQVRPTARWPAGRANVLDVPGSVAVTRIDRDSYDVLICNNGGHTVARHVLSRGARGAPDTTQVLLRKYLEIPDGVSVSSDRRWIAVSNHNPHNVLLYGNSTALNENSQPDGILRGTHYPHGSCFSTDGGHLFVADAGAPYVRIYAREPDDWRGVRYPVASVRVMPDAVFERGRHSPAHGGPKGIDIERASGVVVVTSECQPLAFFDRRSLLQHVSANGSAREPGLLDASYDLMLMEERHQLSRRVTETIDRFQSSTSWRITTPLRWLGSAWRRARRLRG